MGKGDQRSRRGKIFRGTFGKTRPRKQHKGYVAPPAAPAAPVAEAAPKTPRKRTPKPPATT